MSIDSGQNRRDDLITDDVRNLGFFGKIGRHAVRAVSRLPLCVMYVVADICYFFMCHVVRYRRKVVDENLAIVFPDKTEAERKTIRRKFYHHLCDYGVETIKAITMTDEEQERRFRVRNPELVNDIMKSGQSVFLYAAHFGNWEWFTIYANHLDRQFEVHAFYQPQDNAVADRIVKELRSRRGVVAIESHRAFREIVSCSRKGIICSTLVIGDQCPHFSISKYWLDFCGRDTPFLTGPEHMARKLDIALVYPSFYEIKRGYYEVEMKLIELHPGQTPERECTKKFAALLEEDLRRQPHLWLWSHRRWKHNHKDFPNE